MLNGLKLSIILAGLMLGSVSAKAEKYYTTVVTANVRYSNLENQQQESYVGTQVQYRIRYNNSGSIVNFHELRRSLLIEGEMNSSLNGSFEDQGFVPTEVDEIVKLEYLGSNTRGITKGSQFHIKNCEQNIVLSESFARIIGEKSIDLAWKFEKSGAQPSENSLKAMDLIKKGNVSEEDLSMATGLTPTLVSIADQAMCSEVRYNGPMEIQFHDSYKDSDKKQVSHAAHVVIKMTAPETEGF